MTDPQWQILQGDVREVLAGMDDQSVHCVVCSPPYWSLRDYNLPPLLWGGSDECEHEWAQPIIKKGITGGKDNPFAEKLKIKGSDNYQETPDSTSQFCRLCHCWRGSLGLEPTIEMYCRHLVNILREVKRVLRDDGTLWLNLAGSFQDKQWIATPWLVGLALQADGWYLRSPIIWAKGLSFCETYSGSVMPESVSDRPTTSYEHLLLLTKQSRYFYDAIAVREKSEAERVRNMAVVQGPNFQKKGVAFGNDRWLEKPSSKGRQVAVFSSNDYWRFLSECIDHSASILDNPKLQENLRLASLDSQIGQQSLTDRDCHFTPYIPIIARAAILISSGSASDLSAEQLLREAYSLWVALPEHDKLKESWRTAFFHLAFAESNSNRTIGVNDACQIGQVNFLHDNIPPDQQYTIEGTGSSSGRNLRSVWVINPEPLRQKHFAAYPSKLVEPCIKAGTSERGCCPECGKGWERITEPSVAYSEKLGHGSIYRYAKGGPSGSGILTGMKANPSVTPEYRTLGWRPGCSCNAGAPIPCLVLDPFVGSGTSVMVALRLGRRGIGIELSEPYVKMSRNRIIADNPMFNIPGEAQ